MIIWAPTWNWIVAANVLLGINQGLAWSMTVIMKIDLVGPKSRGLAVGLNEFAGYLAVGATAFVTGYIAAATHALRPVLSISVSVTPCWAWRYQCWLFGIRASMSGLRQKSSRKWRLSDSAKYSRGPPFGTQLCSPLARRAW